MRETKSELLASCSNLSPQEDEKERKVAQLCLTLCDPLWTSVHVDSPGKNTGLLLFLSPWDLPTQGSNMGIPTTDRFYSLSHQGSL